MLLGILGYQEETQLQSLPGMLTRRQQEYDVREREDKTRSELQFRA